MTNLIFSKLEVATIARVLGLDHLDICLYQKTPNDGYADVSALIKVKIHQLHLADRPMTSLSISHSGNFGGFAYTKDNGVKIGFDVEETHRVSSEIAKRVSSNKNEFMDAPSPSALWTAKEACFKGLRGPLQPKTISALTLGHWVSNNDPIISHYDTFKLLQYPLSCNTLNFGFVNSKEIYTFSFFTFFS